MGNSKTPKFDKRPSRFLSPIFTERIDDNSVQFSFILDLSEDERLAKTSELVKIIDGYLNNTITIVVNKNN